MARFAAGGRTGAGSTTLPIISVYATAAVAPKVREIGVSNTTATAVALKVVRLSSAGTQGTALTEAGHDPNTYPTAICTAFLTHSSTGPTTADAGYFISLGSAIGSSVIWTFGDTGLTCALGTGNGIGVMVATGSGQVCDAYIVWDE